jgi:predicted S18 family serine protease
MAAVISEVAKALDEIAKWLNQFQSTDAQLAAMAAHRAADQVWWATNYPTEYNRRIISESLDEMVHYVFWEGVSTGQLIPTKDSNSNG